MAGFFGNLLGFNFGVRRNGLGLLSPFGSNGSFDLNPPALPPIVSPAIGPPIDLTRVITSLSSTLAFHSTLFEDFGLRAVSVYNFYTSDEQIGFSQDPSASLASLPRYVFLSWNVAPAPRDFSPSRKGMRPLDQRTAGISPALDIKAARLSVANGYVAPGAVQALLVGPVQPSNDTHKFDEDLFLSSPSAAGRSAADHVTGDSDFHIVSVPQSPDRTRVNFVDPSIAGALDGNRVAMAADHVHLASLGAFAKLASGLEVVSEFNQDAPLRNPVPRFEIAAEAPNLSYTGYIVERYTLNQSGSMELSKTFAIDDPEQNSLVDREVVFGGRYAYRIRTIAQWVHGSTVGFFGSSSLDRKAGFDTSAGSMTREASFFSGDWSDWARTKVSDALRPDPPDELRVMPISHKGMVRITWKMPNDPQRDISAIRLLRSEGFQGRYSDWTQVAEFVPGNGVFVDLLVSLFEESHTSYMYAMYSTSFHGETSLLSEKIVARLTDRSRYLGEEPVRQAGPPGDDPMAHARGPQPPPDTELVVQSEFVAYVRSGRSSVPLFKRTYVIEVQSLTTGERAEVILAVDTTDVGLTPGGTARPA